MPDLAKVLKEEIQRLARKEVKAATDKLRADNGALKRTVTEQKNRIAKLEKDVQRLLTASANPSNDVAVGNGQHATQLRITGKMVRSLRGRLGLSQADLALLLQVNPQTVYQWERKDGRLSFRGNSGMALVEAKGLKAREARERLAQIQEQASTPARGRNRNGK